MHILLVLLTLIILAGGQACSYAQPEDDIHILTTGAKRGAWLGVSLQDVTDKISEKKKLTVKQGALVTEVAEDSPAEKAGIKEGDVIVSFDRSSVEESDDLVKQVGKRKAGTEVEVEVVRDGARKSIKVTLGKRPKDLGLWYTPGAPSTITLPHVSPRMKLFISSESAMLGLEMQELGRQLAEYFEVPGKKGVLVTDVEKESDAAKAGFQAGDVIVKVNGASVADLEDVMEELRDTKAGDRMTFDAMRKGKPVTFNVVKKEKDEDEDEGYLYRFKNFDDSRDMFEMELNRGRLKEELGRLKEELGKMKIDLKDQLVKMRGVIKQKIDHMRHAGDARAVRQS